MIENTTRPWEGGDLLFGRVECTGRKAYESINHALLITDSCADELGRVILRTLVTKVALEMMQSLLPCGGSEALEPEMSCRRRTEMMALLEQVEK